MSKTATIETVAEGAIANGLPVADWDLISAVNNATDYTKLLGGGIVGLLGAAILVVGAVFIAQKFFGNPQSGNGRNWLLIAAMIIVGGAMTYGGFNLVLKVASGGSKTVEELGGGFIVLKSLLWMIH